MAKERVLDSSTQMIQGLVGNPVSFIASLLSLI